MASTHLVERMGKIWRVQGAQLEHDYESGYWVVGEETARKLIGGDLYLHDGQNEPSRFGDKILCYRVHRGDAVDGRVVFRFQATTAHRGVRTPREGWGDQKKIVW